jgi:glycerophosphoryl diester phosphodiesterase
VRLVAHRGASALAPENTLLAVRRAADLGADLVEVDVHLSADGRLVVHHDAARVLPSGERVLLRDRVAADLAAIDVGAGQRIPLLSDVLAVAGATGIGVYVELKAAGSADALAQLLATTPPIGRPEIIGGSFRPALVERLRECLPEVPRSVLFGPASVDEMVRICRDADAAYAHPCRRPIHPSTIATLHAAGLAVMTPHSNDPAELRRFRDAGADVIASDDPRLLEALRRG